MKPAIKYSIFAAIIAVLLIAIFWPRQQNSTQTNETQSQQSTGSSDISVEVYITETERFADVIRTTGNIRADEEIYLQMEASGRITHIAFEEGQTVREGQVLARINASELEAQKRRVEAQMNLAKIREQRQKDLLERQAIAQDEYDVALNELVTMQAELENIKAQIDRRELRAPFDGVIGLRNVSEGAMVSTTDVVASLQKIDVLKIDFSVPERHQRNIDIGSEISYSVQGTEEMKTGKIYAREPRIDQSTRTLRFRAMAENVDFQVLPGAFANVEISLRAIEDAILIPSESLVPEMTGYKVFLYRDGKVQSKDVQIGTRTDRRVLITEGLSPGDSLLTTGLLQVRDGMNVRIDEIREGI